MFTKFEILSVEEHGVVNFHYLGGDVQEKYEVSIIDLNTNLIVHKSHMELKTGFSWWISTGSSNARRLKNAALRIKIGDEYYTENISFNGENRFLVVNSEQKTLEHNGDELFPIVCEIFYDKVYERDFVRINQGDVVVDIGANYGVFSLYAQQFNPSKVFAMEPIKSTFKCLTNNLKGYNVTCVNKAISDEDGFESFALTDINGNNYSLRHSDGFHPSEMKDAEIVESTKFNTFVSDYNIDRIDFLKVDCEGGELDLFETIDTNFLKSSIKKIVIEYHSSSIKTRIIEILTSNGFIIEDVIGMTEIGLIYSYNGNI